MRIFGQVMTEARKRARLSQKEVAERLKREDGSPVDSPYLNPVEHDRRRLPPDHLVEQLAKIPGISADYLFYHARRMPSDLNGEIEHEEVEAAWQAFRKVFTVKSQARRKDEEISRSTRAANKAALSQERRTR
jgi:transcriptional regulator with XRE-family HTH domain